MVPQTSCLDFWEIESVRTIYVDFDFAKPLIQHGVVDFTHVATLLYPRSLGYFHPPGQKISPGKPYTEISSKIGQRAMNGQSSANGDVNQGVPATRTCVSSTQLHLTTRFVTTNS